MALTIFSILDASGKNIGVVHVPLHEKWGGGRMFARPPYAMTQDERKLKKTFTTDTRGAHLVAAFRLTQASGKLYQWRQRVQVTNELGALVDMAEYDPDGDGRPDPSVLRQPLNWVLDRQRPDQHEWYWGKEHREQAVYKNRVYWDTFGRPIDRKLAEHCCLFEDNPNQPMQLLGKFGPMGTFGEIKKHPVTGMPLARELNKQLRVKFATALIETKDAAQHKGGQSLLRFTWGFYVNYDGSWNLYPLRRDDRQ